MNWEYVTSEEVAPNPARGPNAWNTTISTTATITQSSRFLARSFMELFRSPCVNWGHFGGAVSLHLRQLALRQPIHFRRPLSRGRRFADHDLGITTAQVAHVVIEANAL